MLCVWFYSFFISFRKLIVHIWHVIRHCVFNSFHLKYFYNIKQIDHKNENFDRHASKRVDININNFEFRNLKQIRILTLFMFYFFNNLICQNFYLMSNDIFEFFNSNEKCKKSIVFDQFYFFINFFMRLNCMIIFDNFNANLFWSI